MPALLAVWWGYLLAFLYHAALPPFLFTVGLVLVSVSSQVFGYMCSIILNTVKERKVINTAQTPGARVVREVSRGQKAVRQNASQNI